MEPILRACNQCLNMFEPKSEGETLCDTCLDTEIVIGVDMASGPGHQVEHVIDKPERNRMKVLSFSTLHFLLPDDFEGGLGDALRAMADYHESVKRGETRHPASIAPHTHNRETVTLAEHESDQWDGFCDGLDGGFRVCGTVCMVDYIRGDDGEFRSMYMDLSDGKPSQTTGSRHAVQDRTFVIDLIKANEPTPNGRLYSAEVLQSIADQAAEAIKKQPLSIVRFDEDDFEKLAGNPSQQIDRVGLVRHIRFDGEHLVVCGIPMVGKSFLEGARIVPVMEGIVLIESKVSIVEKATIVRFALLPPKDKD